MKTKTQSVARQLQRSRATEEAAGGGAPDDIQEDNVDHHHEDADTRGILRNNLQRQQTIETNGFVDWVKTWFTMPDPDIAAYCGDDALQYLRFQRYIVVYLVIIVIACICVILPINFQGVVQVRKILQVVSEPRSKKLFSFPRALI